MLAGKVILKLEKINVQVTLHDPLVERLRYFVARSLISSARKLFSTKVASMYRNVSRVNFHDTFLHHRALISYNKAGILL